MRETKNVKNLLFLFILLISSLLLVGCDVNSMSFNKSEVDTSFTYNIEPKENDLININYEIKIRNNTIYTISSFTYQLKFYKNGELIKSSNDLTIDYDAGVLYGETFNFTKTYQAKSFAFDSVKLEDVKYDFFDFFGSHIIDLILCLIFNVVLLIFYFSNISDANNKSEFLEELKLYGIIYVISLAVRFLILGTFTILFTDSYAFNWFSFILYSVPFIISVIISVIIYNIKNKKQ